MKKTNRYPFICYNCRKKVNCKKKKYYYGYLAAQKDYENKLKYSRIGIDMSIDEIEYWNEKYKELFEVILTDNGWEFSKPEDIEVDNETGEKLINVFYCESYSSWQKGGIERNHEFIRYIIPKGIAFDTLTKNNIIDMSNHINNVTRKSLKFRTPYDLFTTKYSMQILKKFQLEHIPSNKVCLSYRLLKK